MRTRDLTTYRSPRDNRIVQTDKHDRTGGAPFFSDIHTKGITVSQSDALDYDTISTITDDDSLLADYYHRRSLPSFKFLGLTKSDARRLKKDYPDDFASDLTKHLMPRGVAGVYPRQVKKVIHSKEKFIYDERQTLLYSHSQPFLDGNEFFSTEFELDPILVPGYLGFSQNIKQLFDSAENIDFSQDFIGHDWFAMLSDFDEALTSFTKSSFFLGEDLYESDIFVDAFRILLNPTNALKITLKELKKFSKRKSASIGDYLKFIKNGPNGWLFYNFAVKPALSDIRSIFDAHSIVSRRMEYYRLNAGRYIPIRVSKTLPSSCSHLSPPTSPLATYRYVTDKTATGTMFAMGRCRDDLSFNDTWSAYLQYFGINKVAGLAWELVPCSFILDWFTNAKERVNYYTRFRTGSPFREVTAIGYSLKKKYTEELFCVPPATSPYGGFPMTSPEVIHLASREVSTYERYPGFPETSGVISIDTLGPFRLSLLGSIIYQMIV